jgi:hypothetical protein
MMWAWSSKILVSGLLVIVLLSLATSSSSVIYRQGDWMRYRYDYESGGKKCSWIINVSITEVGGDYVVYYPRLEKMLSGGCDEYEALMLLPTGWSRPVQVNLSEADPKYSRGYVINPDYTGTYNFTDRDMSFRPYNYSYTYYKGILVERRGGFAIYGWTGVVNITLIDTSIPELKSKLGLGEAGAETQQPQEQPVPLYWIIFLIAIPVVSGVAAYMTTKRRRQRQAPATQAIKP